MKAFGCILISALAIIALVPTSGYDVQPLYGRSFNLFNLLTSPQAILSRLTSLTSRFAILQSTVDILSSQFTALQTLVRSLQAQIAALQVKKCPIPSGKTVPSIPGKCFTVKTTSAALTWTDAQSACLPVGGTLAEPPATPSGSQAFYTSLRGQFGPQFTAVEAGATKTLWIGYKTATVTATDVISQILEIPVDYVTPANAIIANPVSVAAATTGFVAAIQGPAGNTWTVFETNAPATTIGYICQYSLI